MLYVRRYMLVVRMDGCLIERNRADVAMSHTSIIFHLLDRLRSCSLGIVPFRPKTAIKSGNSLAEDTIRPLWF